MRESCVLLMEVSEGSGAGDFMNSDSATDSKSNLPALLVRIQQGEEEAARELLRTYESEVRLVVRRQLPRLLRSRFDSIDFLQSVWGSFFRRVRSGPSEFEEPRHLVAFLARAAKNKVIDEYRRGQLEAGHDERRADLVRRGFAARPGLGNRHPQPGGGGQRRVWQASRIASDGKKTLARAQGRGPFEQGGRRQAWH